MLQALFVVSLLLLGQHVHVTSGQSYENMTNLLTDVLTGYNTDVRPLHDLSGTVNVNVSMLIYNILEVDTVLGVITVVQSLECTWYDEKITWSSASYGGIDNIKIQQQYVWIPGLVSTNPVEFVKVGEKWTYVEYQSDGYSKWSPGGVYKIACPMNIKHWPFDEQQCDITYFVYNYKDTEVLVQPIGFNTGFLQENGEWTVETSFGSTTRYGSTELMFTLKLKRRVIFYTDTLIIPLFLLSFLGCFVFLLPSESGERVSYCITILLSITVFLDVISDEIPKLSNPVPMLCQFLLLGIIMDSLITVLVVFNLNLYHKNNSVPINKVYKFVVKLARCRKNSVAADNIQPTETEDTKVHQVGKHQGFIGKTRVSDIHSSRSDVNGDVSGDNQDNNCDVTWQDVSRAFDRILFIVSTGSAVICIPVMIILLNLS